MKANYSIVRNASDTLVIKDIGPWSQYATITNAAEETVTELYSSGVLHEGKKLLYYDSTGHLDELMHSSGEFKGFKAL